MQMIGVGNLSNTVDAVKNGGDPPIVIDELLEVSRVTIALSES